MGRLRRHIRTTRNGSIIVDSAICFPIFIISIAMLLMSINYMKIEENKVYQMKNENYYLSTLSRGINAFTVNQVDKELYIDHVLYNVKVFKTKYLSEITMPYRPFVGASEDPYTNEMVVIFPKNEGSERQTPRYHKRSCWQIRAHRKNGIEAVTQSEAEHRGYTPCMSCH